MISIPYLSDPMDYTDQWDSVRKGKIAQASYEVHKVIQLLENLTAACPNLNALNELRPKLTQVCIDFSNQ